MTGWNRVSGVAVVAVFAVALAFGQEAEKKKTPRVIRPWSDLSTLSDDQRTQIHELHRKALADIRAVREKERADILALLTEAQKAQLLELEAKNKAKRSEPSASETSEEMPE